MKRHNSSAAIPYIQLRQTNRFEPVGKTTSEVCYYLLNKFYSIATTPLSPEAGLVILTLSSLCVWSGLFHAQTDMSTDAYRGFSLKSENGMENCVNPDDRLYQAVSSGPILFVRVSFLVCRGNMSCQWRNWKQYKNWLLENMYMKTKQIAGGRSAESTATETRIILSGFEQTTV